jgi:hypothetical protein
LASVTAQSSAHKTVDLEVFTEFVDVDDKMVSDDEPEDRDWVENDDYIESPGELVMKWAGFAECSG